MKRIIQKHQALWRDRQFFYSALVSFLFLAGSLLLNYAAGTYATNKASNAVTDLFLDNLPVINVDFIFVNGAILLWVFVFSLMIYDPKRIPFLLKSVALFILVRSLFISLTHIGPFPERALLDVNNLFKEITFGGDLFFSGHTGLPFLLALEFWRDKYLRYFFLAASLLFGAASLLGHLHYSIDVFAAFFITYTIFVIAQTVFAKDYKIFLHDLG